jgi:hypothetical protein
MVKRWSNADQTLVKSPRGGTPGHADRFTVNCWSNAGQMLVEYPHGGGG